MATNLISQLLNEMRGDTLNNVAAAIGESPDRTQRALGGVVPALVTGLASKASTTEGATSLLNVIKTNGLESGPFTDVAGALKAPNGLSSLTAIGRPLIDSLFGGRAAALTDWVSSFAGVGRSSSSSLLGLALPLLLGQIGKRVMSSGWSASNLMGLLGEQRQFLHDAPAGLASIFGGTEATPRVNTYERDDVRHVRAHDTELRNIPPAATHHAAPRRSNSWLWALPLLALIPLLIFLFGRDDGRRSDVATATPGSPIPAGTPRPAEPTAVATAGRASLGAMMDRRLPNNVTLRVPSNGLENKLIVFIEDPAQGVTKETWFTFDRLEFESDSARLSPAASEQLRNVAEILKAYPQVKVKIGGYTDNAADPAYNRNLSDQRATAAMNQIAAFGVDRSRLEAEGYGESHPIADNGTAEGRQRNRRVDIRVTAK